MTQKIVLQIEVSWPEERQAWEAHFYQVGCAVAQALAEAYLRDVDEALWREEKPVGWQVVGKRRRTVVARFGEVTIERLYRDREGGGHFLLDEHLV